MKYLNSNITRYFCSGLLLVALILPATLQIIHHLKHQKHPVCKFQGQLHLHQTDVDCELCDFHFNLTVYSVFEQSNDKTIPTKQQQKLDFNFLWRKTQQSSKQLRAPPITS